MIKFKALYGFVSKLSKREKIVFYLSAFFVSLVVMDRLIVQPFYNKLKSLDADIQQMKINIKNNIHVLTQKERIQIEAKKFASYLKEPKSEEEHITALLREVENYANKTQVYLIDIKPTGVREEGLAKKYYIMLNCEAMMEQVADFMYKIETSDQLLIIEKYQISPKSKESSVLKCTMTIYDVVIR